jgi:hypothetical protein
MPRYTPCILLCILACVDGCGPAPASAPVPVVDFIREFDRAETSPAGSYALVVHTPSQTPHPSISAPVPGRIIWQLPLPRRGVFHALVALEGSAGARLRVGVSDDRVYEELARVRLTADRRDWTSLDADLSSYAGWKWSLFYRPDRIAWRVVLSADAIDGVPSRVVWGMPLITTDVGAAHEYAKRRAKLTRSGAP